MSVNGVFVLVNDETTTISASFRGWVKRSLGMYKQQPNAGS